MFNPNVTPKDDRGEPIREGRYAVFNPRYNDTLLAQVHCDDELTLWVKFEGVERPQRLDEISLFSEWKRL